MSDYIPVPVKAARAIAEDYSKSIVIIASWDPAYGLLHTTTYGDDPQNKAWAAQGGEIVTKALGGLREAATDFEDYRLELALKLMAALKGLMDESEIPLAERLKAAREVVVAAEKFLARPGPSVPPPATATPEQESTTKQL